MTVTSRGDPGQLADSVLTTQAGATYGVRVMPSADSQDDRPGATVTYTLQVENSGNVQDTFSMTLSGNVWTTGVAPTTVGPLVPDAQASVLVAVDIPSSASDGDTDTVTVSVTSQGDPTQSDHATLTTEARGEAPGPEWEVYLPIVLRGS